MKIERGRVVTFYYHLTEQGGAPLEGNQGEIPMAYLHGYNNLLPALEASLEGLASGDQKKIILPEDQAYGPVKENALHRIPIKHLVTRPKHLRPGMVVKVQTDDGVINAKVVKAGKFVVNIDVNHPFAGKTLEFDIRIVSIRDATSEELTHGHAHGEGGHHH